MPTVGSSILETSRPSAPASPLLRTHPIGLDARIRHRRKLMQTPASYDVLGRLMMIIFHPERYWRECKPPGITVMNQSALDWQEPGDPVLPTIAISKDGYDLLILDVPLRHPPQLVDTSARLDDLKFGKVDQHYRDRSEHWFKNFLRIWPIFKIVYKPAGVADWRFILGQASLDGTGTYPDFLVDPKVGEAHIIGGSFRIGTVR